MTRSLDEQTWSWADSSRVRRAEASPGYEPARSARAHTLHRISCPPASPSGRLYPPRFLASSARRLLLLAVLFAGPVALAQADEQLPDLTPRAFEIRGDLQISLPNLERQPLRGFAPPPRTYVVPGDRRTYVADYRQPLDGLPADGLAAPAPPDASALAPLTGRIDAGFGRYVSRLGRLTLNGGGFGLDARYDGFSQFSPSALTDAALATDEAGADAFGGRLAYASPGPVRFGAALDGDYDRYTLIGTGLGAPDRTARTIGGEAFVDSAVPGGTPFELAVRFATTDVEVDAEDTPGLPGGALDQSELRFEADGGVDASRVRFDAGAAFSGLGDEGLGESLTSYAAGGALRVPVGRGRLEVGARVLGYTASDANGGGSSTNIGPVVDFELPVSATTRLFARTDPGVERRGLAGLVRENPYAVPEPFVAPDLHVVDGEGGLEVQAESVRLVAFGGAVYSPVRLYFERSVAGETAGLYEARYDEALVVRGGATATLYAPSGLRVTLGAEVRAGTLLDADRDMPYFAPVVGHASAALPFAGERGLLQVTGTVESARPTEDEDVDADAWARLDAEAHYFFTTGVGVLVRAERLAGQAEQWPGFPRPPATVLAGLRVRW